MVDRCVMCGEIIPEGRQICPICEKGKTKMGKGVKFERIRRITGYLVGTLDKWNDAKKAEERDRVKHGVKKEAKIKTPLAKIIVSGTAEKPYYDILWLDAKNKTFNIGYGSYNLTYVFQWLSEHFEVVEDG